MTDSTPRLWPRVVYLVDTLLADAEATRLSTGLGRVEGVTFWRASRPDGRTRFELVVPTREDLAGA